MLGNVLLSAAVTIVIYLIVDYTKYRLNNVTINKINKAVIEGFSAFFIDDDLSGGNIGKFNIYMSQRLGEFGLDKKIMDFKAKLEKDGVVSIMYKYNINGNKYNTVNFILKRKSL